MYRCMERMQAYAYRAHKFAISGVVDTGLAMFMDVGLPSDVDPYLLPTMMISLRAFVAVDELLQLPVLGLQ